MLGTNSILVSCLMLPLALGLAGCSKSAPSTAPTSTPAAAESQDDHQDHGDQDGHAKEGEQDPEVAKALAELSPDDRSLAERQRICPVTGELLGSMGAPIKVDVNGEPVFICCEGCKEELLKNPAEHLAKLKK